MIRLHLALKWVIVLILMDLLTTLMIYSNTFAHVGIQKPCPRLGMIRYLIIIVFKNNSTILHLALTVKNSSSEWEES